MHHMETLRMFIGAERTGDWNLQLVAVSRMLNIFAATTSMQNVHACICPGLPESHLWLYEQFMCHSYHTVHKSDQYWSGLSTDLVIE